MDNAGIRIIENKFKECFIHISIPCGEPYQNLFPYGAKLTFT